MNTFRDQDEQLTSLKVQLVREKVDNRGLRQRVVACDDESSAKSGQIRELEKALIGVKASQEGTCQPCPLSSCVVSEQQY
ncbi:hypothetical protein CPB85DRAFT_204749 [Mucidula mucida]|nr:hypothetical protein CPB85DRAFT_204749 [Mucidula mucida]